MRVGSAGCPKCRSGTDDEVEGDWQADGADIPDDGEDFDYAEWEKKEFGRTARVKPHGLHWIWWVTGLLLVLGMLAGAVGALFL